MRAFSFWGPLLALAIIDCGHVGNGEEMMFPNSLWASPLPAQIGMMSVVHKIDIDYSHEYAKDVCFADQVALALFAAFDCEPREVNASFEVLWHKYAMDIIGKRSVIRGSRQHCRKIPTYTNGLYKSNCSASVGYPDGADCIKTSWHQDSSTSWKTWASQRNLLSTIIRFGMEHLMMGSSIARAASDDCLVASTAIRVALERLMVNQPNMPVKNAITRVDPAVISSW